ncbi:MAG: hypothetical protein O6649_00195 [Gammaproteobacteria bacterium]|nr:hypothetical protein [Gammaproteobacteria bacterium]
MTIQTHKKILLVLVSCVCFSPAWGHSFNIVFIAPISEPAGQSALEGFLFATREQDSHAFEESDGHLGGLDSFVFRIDSELKPGPLHSKVEAIIRENEPLFAAGFIAGTKIESVLEKNAVTVVDPIAVGLWPSLISSPEKIHTMDGGDFLDVFRQRHGRPPDLNTIRGYLAARVIARVVRKSDSRQRSDPGKLAAAVSMELQRGTW